MTKTQTSRYAKNDTVTFTDEYGEVVTGQIVNVLAHTDRYGDRTDYVIRATGEFGGINRYPARAIHGLA